jgi:hypothetical protein
MTPRRSTDQANGPVTRAVAYLRVSTAGQAERGMGLQAQRQSVRDYLASSDGAGLELVGVEQEAASGAARYGELFSLEHPTCCSYRAWIG